MTSLKQKNTKKQEAKVGQSKKNYAGDGNVQRVFSLERLLIKNKNLKEAGYEKYKFWKIKPLKLKQEVKLYVWSRPVTIPNFNGS